MNSLGICIGASTIKASIIKLENSIPKIDQMIIRSHECDPGTAYKSMIEEIRNYQISKCLLTGRKFRNSINLPSITESEAVEAGLDLLGKMKVDKHFDALISLGAENFVLYNLDNKHCISSVETGNKCASGTGEFFLQQVRRMGLDVQEAVECAQNSLPYKVSGRCSVFCKSDCTHALNKGIPAGRVSAGLCRMIADKILELLDKAHGKSIITVGGVTENFIIMEMLKNEGLDLFVPHFASGFEAAGAAWQAFKTGVMFKSDNSSIEKKRSSFRIHPPLLDAVNKVRFEKIPESEANSGDELIVGLDVGSTTTKAVALRMSDSAVVGSIYLRTNGNPVLASRECYRNLIEQLPADVVIGGIGTTGSGRQIAALHAKTDCVINEIIAHAAAAAYFDSDVDTVFEIGGQDAKYTSFTNGVPSDYAMNEACSAGTGSFLEEAAKESLGIDYRSIQDLAIKADSPPDFNDQCAAFISSDIKTASHENISKENIVAGLVYSICTNYVNRVKGQRPVGKKILMQGGVCYNKAVPLAMANLIDAEIIVPPEPGLMGAFGVALELKKRIDDKLVEKKVFDLNVIADREVEFGKSFYCNGGSEKCDRNCEINMLKIDGDKFPFGGACYRYYNQLYKKNIDSKNLNEVALRQNIFLKPVQKVDAFKNSPVQKIGLNSSFLHHSLFPLFGTFFSELGMDIVLSDTIDPNGIKRKGASFCYPVDIAHGLFANLISKNPDIIFLPSVVEMFVHQDKEPRREHQCTCMSLQSEPYLLKSAFKDLKTKVLSPVLDFSKGYESQEDEFVKIGAACNCGPELSRKAYQKAIVALDSCTKETRSRGEEILRLLENDPNKIIVVLFGRPYNAFANEANMGIPGKFASRGVTIIPWDYLDYNKEAFDEDINWALAQNVLRAAKITASHKQIFGVFITNFSCGPDSFILGYFRDIMGSKPSLTIELDSHTADAGINTRIEAFLDIVERYRRIEKRPVVQKKFTAASISFEKRKPFFNSSGSKSFKLNDPSVRVLIPSMGKLVSESMSAAFVGTGIKSTAMSVYDQETLKAGRANTSCKECLPLILTTGGLISYLKDRADQKENLVYFMPTCGGNCRFTQYYPFLRKLINKLQIDNAALLSLTNENGYAGLKITDVLNVLKAIIVSDCMEDVRNSLKVLAKNCDRAMELFDVQWEKILDVFRKNRGRGLYKVLKKVVDELSKIPLRCTMNDVPSISLMGEIFVRRDYFSCQDLIERLAQRNIIVKRSPVSEWLNYCDFNISEGIYEARFDFKGFFEFHTRTALQKRYEHKIMSIFAKSNLYSYEHTDIKSIIECGKNFFDVRFTGEAILVAGGFFKNILHTIHGAINIGPFGCMPTRITEAVVTPCLSKQSMSGVTEHKHLAADISTLPFLSLETDGSPFSQLQETKIEAFCLQVERVYQKLNKKSHVSPSPFYRDALVVSDDPVSETKKGDLPEVIDKK